MGDAPACDRCCSTSCRTRSSSPRRARSSCYVEAEPAGHGRRPARIRGTRHRDRDPAGPDGPPVHVLQPGRRIDDATLRRNGARTRDLEALVELMGGTIRAESEEGKGSTFRIALTADAAERADAAGRPRTTLPQLLGKRVLVVDDNATNREIVTRHARAWRMEPVAVESGAEALALIDGGREVRRCRARHDDAAHGRRRAGRRDPAASRRGGSWRFCS